MSNTLEQYLKSRPFYKGQFFSVVPCKGTKTTGEPERHAELPAFFRKYLDVHGLAAPYEHQWNLLKHFLEFKEEERVREKGQHTRQRDFVLATALGSGRSFAADMVALYTVLVKARNVLVVCPDRDHALVRGAQIKARIHGKPWRHAVRLSVLSDAESARAVGRTAGDDHPQIAVVTPQTLKGEILFSTGKLWRSFFSLVDLVVWEDIHQYTGIFGGNVQWLSRRLRSALGARKGRDQSSPAFVATSRPVRNLPQFSMSLLQAREEALEVINGDHRDDSERTVAIWSMPFMREEIKKEDSFVYRLARVLFMEDVNHLLRALLNWEGLAHDLPLLLQHSMVGKRDVELHTFVHDQASQRSRRRTCIAVDHEDLYLNSTPPLLITGVSTVVSAGNRASVFTIDQEYCHIGGDIEEETEKNVVLINDHSPLSEYLARTFKEEIERNYSRSPVITEGLCLSQANRSLARRELLEILSRGPCLLGELQRDFSGFSIESLVDDLHRHLNQDLIKRRLRHVTSDNYEEELFIPAEGIELLKGRMDALGASLNVVTSELVPVVFLGPGHQSFHLDEASAPSILYEGASFPWEGSRFRVNEMEARDEDRSRLARIKITVPGMEVGLPHTHKVKIPRGSDGVGESSLSVSFPAVGKNEGEISKGWECLLRRDGTKSLDHCLTKIRVQEKVRGYREIPAFECDLSKWQSTRENPRPWNTVAESRRFAADFETTGMLLRFSPEGAGDANLATLNHTIKHLFKILMPVFIPHKAIELEMVLLEGCGGHGHPKGDGWWVMYENIVDGGGLVDYLAAEQDILRGLLEKALDLLKRCPCAQGCGACLHIHGCREATEYNKQLDKGNTMRFLAHVLGEEKGIEELIRVRTGPIGQAGDEQLLRDYEKRIRAIYREKLGVEMTEDVHVRFMAPGEPAWANASIAGYYDPVQRLIVVRPGPHLSEQALIGILAHEQFHHWQSHNTGHPGWHAGVLEFTDSEYIDNPQNIPYYGRMFVEGSAQWGEYKILDYYGFRGPMEGITDTHYCQYGEGFRACKWIEDSNDHGMPALLDFFTKGRLLNAAGADVSLDRLYHASGVDASVGEIYRRYQAEGKLVCALKMRRTQNVRVVTYFFFICEEMVRHSRAGGESMKDVLARLRNANRKIADLHCSECKAIDICTLEDACYLHSVFNAVSKTSLMEKLQEA